MGSAHSRLKARFMLVVREPVRRLPWCQLSTLSRRARRLGSAAAGDGRAGWQHEVDGQQHAQHVPVLLEALRTVPASNPPRTGRLQHADGRSADSTDASRRAGRLQQTGQLSNYCRGACTGVMCIMLCQTDGRPAAGRQHPCMLHQDVVGSAMQPPGSLQQRNPPTRQPVVGGAPRLT